MLHHILKFHGARCALNHSGHDVALCAFESHSKSDVVKCCLVQWYFMLSTHPVSNHSRSSREPVFMLEVGECDHRVHDDEELRHEDSKVRRSPT